jgi:hypothetical protein
MSPLRYYSAAQNTNYLLFALYPVFQTALIPWIIKFCLTIHNHNSPWYQMVPRSHQPNRTMRIDTTHTMFWLDTRFSNCFLLLYRFHNEGIFYIHLLTYHLFNFIFIFYLNGKHLEFVSFLIINITAPSTSCIFK